MFVVQVTNNREANKGDIRTTPSIRECFEVLQVASGVDLPTAVFGLEEAYEAAGRTMGREAMNVGGGFKFAVAFAKGGDVTATILDSVGPVASAEIKEYR